MLFTALLIKSRADAANQRRGFQYEMETAARRLSAAVCGMWNILSARLLGVLGELFLEGYCGTVTLNWERQNNKKKLVLEGFGSIY